MESKVESGPGKEGFFRRNHMRIIATGAAIILAAGVEARTGIVTGIVTDIKDRHTLVDDPYTPKSWGTKGEPRQISVADLKDKKAAELNNMEDRQVYFDQGMKFYKFLNSLEAKDIETDDPYSVYRKERVIELSNGETAFDPYSTLGVDVSTHIVEKTGDILEATGGNRYEAGQMMAMFNSLTTQRTRDMLDEANIHVRAVDQNTQAGLVSGVGHRLEGVLLQREVHNVWFITPVPGTSIDESALPHRLAEPEAIELQISMAAQLETYQNEIAAAERLRLAEAQG